ncbi:ABC transporter permease [Microlunatus panaciterrae]|uniref:Oligopeptide transport system permease protein OppC n=1 Tax=Microlunatus panaciterrae TaxID=400768 RepID=A0ABS2RIQ2_9ACTN|nr:ABC transporter permease [Microlunatus panaciterrae]MBM7798091.1 peptide/nickel transport system permease protein [Microlunatus panaciterrae]
MSDQVIHPSRTDLDIIENANEPGPSAPIGTVQPTTKRLTRSQLIFRRFLRNKTAVVGLIVYLVLILMAIFGPLISPWHFDDVDRTAYLKPPSPEHWFGTTQSGRDVLALTMRGLRKSLLIGLLVAGISTTIAATVGSFAAYFGGWFERIALWFIDLLLVIPSFLIIAIVTTGGPKGPHSWLLLVVMLAGFSWFLSARVVRSLTMSVKEREYVLAARFMGLSAPKIVFRHIVPNISSLLIIDATLGVGGAVLAEASLSFFGFGVQAPDTSLGTLISEGQRMATTFPWIFLCPAAVLVVMVLAINAVGDGLRDALDPNSNSGGKAA